VDQSQGKNPAEGHAGQNLIAARVLPKIDLGRRWGKPGITKDLLVFLGKPVKLRIVLSWEKSHLDVPHVRKNLQSEQTIGQD